jgi:hypothetical protein
MVEPIWEKNRGNPSLLFQQGRPCVKVMVLVSKWANPIAEIPFTLEILEETQFSP